MLRFLHAADLHIGMRLTRFSKDAINRIREARFEALENIRLEAGKRDREYQFVVIAGDLFDDVRVPREIAGRTFKLLESFPIPVVVISGNHDPCEPGAAWDADPWNRDDAERIHLLREREPYRVLPGVTCFPCPVFRKTSYDDPTTWIAGHPRSTEDGYRIGIAHGSVMDRPNLPDDDHPIAPDAPAALDLDYLALGHWHAPKRYCDDRMAYPGVHEPMRFSASDASGWKPYTSGGDEELFLDDGRGRVLAVTLDTPGAVPEIEEINVGRLNWRDRENELLHADQLDELIRDVADPKNQPELTLLRIRLSGALPLKEIERLEELRLILGRYVVGELDDTELHAVPTEEEIRDVVGSGILKTVFDRIAETRAAGGDSSTAAIAEHALKLLYRYAGRTGGRS